MYSYHPIILWVVYLCIPIIPIHNNIIVFTNTLIAGMDVIPPKLILVTQPVLFSTDLRCTLKILVLLKNMSVPRTK